MRELVFDESENVASVLVCLMESLIREDSIFLQQYEKQLTEIETLLLDGVPENFYATILQLRKEVMVLHGYYVQLENMSDLIETNTNKMLTENEMPGVPLFCGSVRTASRSDGKSTGIYSSDSGNVSVASGSGAKPGDECIDSDYGDFYASDTDCRLVWHELYTDAGACLAVWLSAGYHYQRFDCGSGDSLL